MEAAGFWGCCNPLTAHMATQGSHQATGEVPWGFVAIGHGPIAMGLVISTTARSFGGAWSPCCRGHDSRHVDRAAPLCTASGLATPLDPPPTPQAHPCGLCLHVASSAVALSRQYVTNSPTARCSGCGRGTPLDPTGAAWVRHWHGVGQPNRPLSQQGRLVVHSKAPGGAGGGFWGLVVARGRGKSAV